MRRWNWIDSWNWTSVQCIFSLSQPHNVHEIRRKFTTTVFHYSKNIPFKIYLIRIIRGGTFYFCVPVNAQIHRLKILSWPYRVTMCATLRSFTNQQLVSAKIIKRNVIADTCIANVSLYGGIAWLIYNNN